MDAPLLGLSVLSQGQAVLCRKLASRDGDCADGVFPPQHRNYYLAAEADRAGEFKRRGRRRGQRLDVWHMQNRWREDHATT